MIKIIGSIKEAQKALKTNVALTPGQILSGDEAKMKQLCQKFPNLFEWEGKDWAAHMKKKPSKNKMMNRKKANSK